MDSANEERLAQRCSGRLLGAAGALLLTCVPGAALAQSSEAEKPSAQATQPAKPESDPRTAPAAGAVAQEKSASPPAAADAPKPAAVADGRETFVDRDGDGIQDGQEHRFRRRGSGARSTEQSLGGEKRQTQTRYRGGDGHGRPGPGGNGPRN